MGDSDVISKEQIELQDAALFDKPQTEASGYRAPDDCYDLVAKICHSVSEAMRTPIVLDIYGEAADILNQWARDRALGYIAWASSHPAPPAPVQPAASEEEVEPPDALLRDVIDYAEGGKVPEPWMVRGLTSLRAQLAERTVERPFLEGIQQSLADFNDSVERLGIDLCGLSQIDEALTDIEAALDGKEAAK